ncbi:nucleotide-binding protein [Sabulicella glaciei]|uniref:ParA family protein n=1 Tax=Sabulicella glaciei TaxID=2984948 RepID=A0ABT3P253_9PROT|nr:P-loop NTPase [Roseococcus sp. MDT2-1-1]MCW8088476.1 ParA family protein [Roseococcus sp. MDT2-1-1]
MRSTSIPLKRQIFWTLSGKGGVGKSTVACAILDALIRAGIDVVLIELDQEGRLTAMYKGQLGKYAIHHPINAEVREDVMESPDLLNKPFDDTRRVAVEAIRRGAMVVVDMGGTLDMRLASWLESSATLFEAAGVDVTFVVPMSRELPTWEAGRASVNRIGNEMTKAKFVFALTAQTKVNMFAPDDPAVKGLLEEVPGSRAVPFPLNVSTITPYVSTQEKPIRPFEVVKMDFAQLQAAAPLAKPLGEDGILRGLGDYKRWWVGTEAVLDLKGQIKKEAKAGSIHSGGVIAGTVPSKKMGFAEVPDLDAPPPKPAAQPNEVISPSLVQSTQSQASRLARPGAA